MNDVGGHCRPLVFCFVGGRWQTRNLSHTSSKCFCELRIVLTAKNKEGKPKPKSWIPSLSFYPLSYSIWTVIKLVAGTASILIASFHLFLAGYYLGTACAKHTRTFFISAAEKLVRPRVNHNNFAIGARDPARSSPRSSIMPKTPGQECKVFFAVFRFE
jgi:hypothetical protein